MSLRFGTAYRYWLARSRYAKPCARILSSFLAYRFEDRSEFWLDDITSPAVAPDHPHTADFADIEALRYQR
ncbi:MAG: hypothetical protein ABL904_03825, partial [Hyphomicrobiaceae bacterium]